MLFNRVSLKAGKSKTLYDEANVGRRGAKFHNTFWKEFQSYRVNPLNRPPMMECIMGLFRTNTMQKMTSLPDHKRNTGIAQLVFHEY